MLRKVITIDEDLCDGCGECVPNCPEGALRIIDGKARLVGDLFCDGLGACIGHCPQGAITIEEREAERYDERRVMDNIVPKGENVLRAHLEHLQDHGLTEYVREGIEYLIERDLEVPEEFRSENGFFTNDTAQAAPAAGGAAKDQVTTGPASAPEHDSGSISKTGVAECGCPGSRVIDMRENGEMQPAGKSSGARPSRLRQWPVQIMLVPPSAPYLQGADLLIAADCVAFAHPDFHDGLLDGKVLLVGCPKLDDADFYTKKLAQIFTENDIKSITVAHMEVPCCFGMMKIVESALAASGKRIPVEDVTVTVRGETAV